MSVQNDHMNLDIHMARIWVLNWITGEAFGEKSVRHSNLGGSYTIIILS